VTSATPFKACGRYACIKKEVQDKVATENRRNLERVNKELPAWYRFDRNNFRKSAVLDVSEGGSRLMLSEAMPDGEVHVKIRVANEHVTYIAQCAWQRPLASGVGYLVGLRFLDSAPVDSGRLNRWIRRQVQLRQLAAS
jgi:hypothetical protein